MDTTKDEIEAIAKVLVDAMVTVHRELGPGLLESTYQACLAYELRSRRIEVQCEAILPVRYKGLEIEAGYRIVSIYWSPAASLSRTSRSRS